MSKTDNRAELQRLMAAFGGEIKDQAHKLLTVESICGQKTTELEGSPPDALARLLLTELVAKADELAGPCEWPLRAAVVNRADYAKQALGRRMAADRRMTSATPSKKPHSLILTGPIFDAVTFSPGA
jgi:hypothetical protein